MQEFSDLLKRTIQIKKRSEVVFRQLTIQTRNKLKTNSFPKIMICLLINMLLDSATIKVVLHLTKYFLVIKLPLKIKPLTLTIQRISR